MDFERRHRRLEVVSLLPGYAVRTGVCTMEQGVTIDR